MPTSTVSGKNQITLPVNLTRQLGIQPGDKLAIEIIGGELVIIPQPDSWVQYFQGSMKGTYGQSKEQADRLIAEERASWEASPPPASDHKHDIPTTYSRNPETTGHPITEKRSSGDPITYRQGRPAPARMIAEEGTAWETTPVGSLEWRNRFEDLYYTDSSVRAIAAVLLELPYHIGTLAVIEILVPKNLTEKHSQYGNNETLLTSTLGKLTSQRWVRRIQGTSPSEDQFRLDSEIARLLSELDAR